MDLSNLTGGQRRYFDNYKRGQYKKSYSLWSRFWMAVGDTLRFLLNIGFLLLMVFLLVNFSK